MQLLRAAARALGAAVLLTGSSLSPLGGGVLALTSTCSNTTACISGLSCDHWVDESGGVFTCPLLENIYNCDCGGCLCTPQPATTTTTTAPHNPTTPAVSSGSSGSATSVGPVTPAHHHKETTVHPQINPWAVPENPYWRQFQNWVDASNEVIETVEDVLEEEEEVDPALTAARVVATIVLCCFSALFSGLTLGLMGLDTAGLDVIVQADPNGINGRRAKKILVLRRDGNLLLCTLLLGNVAVNALVPIFLEELVDPTASFIISTFVLVIVGEITPQAVCSRYALAIGASVIWIMRIFTVLLYVLAKPIAMVLDRVLGEEMGTIYNKNQLIEVVKHHRTHGALDHDEAQFVKGALEYTSKSVWEVYTSVSSVFMLDADAILDFDLISTIFKKGHSRIPVKSTNSRGDVKIVGILLVKDLVLLDPEDCVPVKEVLDFFKRPVITVDMADSLVEVMEVFKRHQFHLAMVTNVATDEAQPGLEVVVHSPPKPRTHPSLMDKVITQQSLVDDGLDFDDDASFDNGGGMDMDVGGDGKAVAMVPMGKAAVDRSSHSAAAPPATAAAALSHASLREREELSRQLNPVLPVLEKEGSDHDDGDGGGGGGANGKNSGSASSAAAAVNDDAKDAKDDDDDDDDDDDGDLKQVMGIITMEDIIECLLGTQIMDEADTVTQEMVAANWSSGGVGGSTTKTDAKVNLLSAVRTRIADEMEMDIIINHLLENVRPFQIKRHGYQISEYALTHLLRDSEIHTFKRGDVIIRAGEHTDSMILVLDGTLVTETGRDKFKALAGSLSTIGDGALAFPEDDHWHYIPDFTVTVSSSKARVLLIKREGFRAAYSMTRERDVQALRTILASSSSRSVSGRGGSRRALTMGSLEQRAQIRDADKHASLL